MAHVTLYRPTTGETCNVPSGFSWTLFLFGIFVPLFRGDVAAAVAYLVLLALVLVVPVLFPVYLIVHAVICFLYNANYVERLENQGWKRKYYE